MTAPITASGRRRIRTAIAAATVLVVAAVAVLAWFRPWEDHAAPGEVVGVPADEVTGDPVDLLLPVAGLTVRIGDPQDAAPHSWSGGEGSSWPDPPPRGGSYLPVSVETTMPDGLSVTRLPDAEQVEPEVTVDAGGMHVDLTDEIEPSFGAGTVELDTTAVWIAVDGAPQDAVVTITFDGESQTVAADGTVDEGRFAELDAAGRGSGPPDDGQRDCGEATFPSGFRESSADHQRARCRLTESTSPWVGGLGWAPPNAAWLVAGVVVDPAWSVTRAGSGDELILETDVEVRPEVLVDGEEPAAAYVANDAVIPPLMLQDPEDPWVVVTEVSDDGAWPTLEITYPAVYGRHGTEETVPARWTVELG